VAGKAAEPQPTTTALQASGAGELNRHTDSPGGDSATSSIPPALSGFARASQAEGCCVVVAPAGYEADDLIAALAMHIALEHAFLIPPVAVSSMPGAACQQAAGNRPVALSAAPAEAVQVPPQDSLLSQQQQQIQQGLLQQDENMQACALQHHRRVCIASGDSDMQSLLSLPGVSWLEILQAPGATSAGGEPAIAGNSFLKQHSSTEPSPHPTVMDSYCLHGICWLPVRLHTAPAAQPHQPCSSAVQGAAKGGCSSGDYTINTTNNNNSRTTCKHNTDQVSSTTTTSHSSTKRRHIPPALYPDYLALVGKPEAGIKGAGVSSNAALGLLLKFGGVASIAQAYLSGWLTGRLQVTPAAPRVTPSTAQVGASTMLAAETASCWTAAGTDTRQRVLQNALLNSSAPQSDHRLHDLVDALDDWTQHYTLALFH
jgi:hypothetical protein